MMTLYGMGKLTILYSIAQGAPAGNIIRQLDYLLR